jgi:hypothetical protein
MKIWRNWEKKALSYNSQGNYAKAEKAFKKLIPF